ncbi:hypothetical protein Ae201684P_016420 [Aphanomyces euteiches]|nr:hypothetical protein Ae201684P_016420 [Aphanomyces euteiches]
MDVEMQQGEEPTTSRELISLQARRAAQHSSSTKERESTSLLEIDTSEVVDDARTKRRTSPLPPAAMKTTGLVYLAKALPPRVRCFGDNMTITSSELFRQLAVSNANAERAIEVAEARAAAAEEEKERQAAVLAKRLHDADVVSQAQQQVLAGATRQYQEMAARLAQAKVERENALYVATLSTSEVNRLNSEQNEANNRHAMESARQAQHVDFVTASATDAIQRQAEAAAAESDTLEWKWQR